MSTLAPLSHGPRRHNHRSSRHYYNSTSSSQSLSNNSSLSDKSFNLEDGGGQASPLPPPLPQRPTQRLAASIQQLQQLPNHEPFNGASHLNQNVNRNSHYYWSDGSGSTRLPAFPDEENNSVRSSQLAIDTIRLQQYKHPTVQHVRSSKTNQLGCAAYQHRPPVVATAVVYPSTGAHSYPVTGGSLAVTRAPNVLLTSSTSPSSPPGSAVGGFHGYATVDSGGYAARGCGGRCETCENVCYYLMQVSFAMGVLIGTSLCIAGTALRRSPGRQLQVLLYIGALVALVCSLLLIVQCRARRQANRYYQQHNHQPTLQPHQHMATHTVAMQQQQLHVADAIQRQQQPKPLRQSRAPPGRYNVPSMHHGDRQHANQRNRMYLQPKQLDHNLHRQEQLVPKIQRGVPITLLQQQPYIQSQNSGLDNRDRNARIFSK